MFLGESDIRKRLAKGDLRIEPPPNESQITGFGVDLRLGTQFARMSPRSERPRLNTIPLGDGFSVASGDTVFGIGLEYVHIPLDLAGILLPISALARLGLFVETGTIDPGFQGKLALPIRNVGSLPITLYPGQRIVRLCFALLTSIGVHEGFSTTVLKEDDIEAVKSALEKSAPQPAPDAASTSSLKDQLSRVLHTKGTEKGQALETLMESVFTSLQGLHVIKRNARLAAEELDLIIRNDLNTGFWRIAGSPLVVECKNWSRKVGAREVSVLLDKLQAPSPDAKAGILVAVNGITGSSRADANLKIREARQRGRYILVFNSDDLRALANELALGQLIERKYDELVLI